MDIQGFKSRSEENLERVRNLVEIYRSLESNGKKHGKHDADLLRAAVVLLHATLEDFVRVLVGWKLPLSSSEQIKKSELRIPFHQLADYRECSVGKFMQQSIEGILTRSTYNSKDDVSKALKSIGLDANTSKVSELETAMTRRHKIVHRGDRGSESESGRINPIQADHVAKWIRHVDAFMRDVLAQLGSD